MFVCGFSFYITVADRSSTFFVITENYSDMKANLIRVTLDQSNTRRVGPISLISPLSKLISLVCNYYANQIDKKIQPAQYS